MSGKTRIEWTDRVWNPVTGCSKVSIGCANCYAERMDRRFNPEWKEWTGPNAAHNVRLHPERLELPLSWQKPQRIFLNSMSDLFYEQVPDEFIDQVFAIMAIASRHTFQILTKRPKRMLDYLAAKGRRNEVARWARTEGIYRAQVVSDGYEESIAWPLPNVWLGVSAEDQYAADERVMPLLQTPAAVRFLSCEPLLGPIDLNQIAMPDDINRWLHFSALHEHHDDCYYSAPSQLDWVIVGGESGPGARPMHPDWVGSLRDQCIVAEVPFFFKQWGEWAPYIDDSKFTYGSEEAERNMQHFINVDGSTGVLWITDDDGTVQNWTRDFSTGSCIVNRFGKKRSGRELDGRTWDELPVTDLIGLAN